MPYSIRYDEAGFILLIYEGNANVKDIREVLTQGVTLALEHNCYCVLSDLRAMKLNLSITTLFAIPERQQSHGAEMNVPYYKFKRAMVVPRAQFEKYKFFETVAVNRAHTIKIFLEMDAATTWLLE